MNDKNFRNRLTPELMDAMDTVCGACPYVYIGGHKKAAEICERCMVRHMYNLFVAERDAGNYLDFDSPEWQAIINY